MKIKANNNHESRLLPSRGFLDIVLIGTVCLDDTFSFQDVVRYHRYAMMVVDEPQYQASQYSRNTLGALPQWTPSKRP